MSIEADLKAWRNWWIYTADQAESTIDEYVKHVRRYVEEYGDTLSPRNANAFVAETCQRSMSVGMLAWRALRSYAKWLETVEGEAPSGLCSQRFPRPKEPTAQRIQVATDADRDKLLATCESDSMSFRDVRDHAILSVIASTGMRLSEVTRMHWADISDDLTTIRIPKTKNREIRVTRLSADAQRSLRRYRRWLDKSATSKRPEYCWVGYVGPFGQDGIRQMITARAKRAGVDVTAHSFRRGFAVKWLSAGGPESYLRTIAGWKRPDMVARYTSLVKQEEALKAHEVLFG